MKLRFPIKVHFPRDLDDYFRFAQKISCVVFTLMIPFSNWFILPLLVLICFDIEPKEAWEEDLEK